MDIPTFENASTSSHQSKKQKIINEKKRYRQENAASEEQPRKKRPKKAQDEVIEDAGGLHKGDATRSNGSTSSKEAKGKSKKPREAVVPTHGTAVTEHTNHSVQPDMLMVSETRQIEEHDSEKRERKGKKRRNKEVHSSSSTSRDILDGSQLVPDISDIPVGESLVEDYVYDPDALPFNDEPFDLSTLGMRPMPSNDDLLRAIGSMDLASLGRATGHVFTQEAPGPSNGQSTARPAKKKKARGGNDSIAMHNPNDPLGILSKWLSPADLKKAAEEHGLEYSKGKFTAAEKDTIQAWFDSFAMANQLSDEQVVEIIFTPKGSLLPEYKSLWFDLASALPKRPITAVFNYVRRAYNPLKGQGKWTEEEDSTLKAAVVEFGQMWTKVSGRVGRPATDCRDRYRNHLINADNRVHGAWNAGEMAQLMEIMAEFDYEKPKGEDHDTFWREISRRMGGTRSAAQVRGKWQDSLSRTVKPDGQRRWSPVDSYILVHKIATMEVADESEIDWKLLIDDGWNLWSPHVMQKRWLSMKKRIEGHETMPFYELVDILMAKKGSLSQTEIEEALKKSQEARPMPRTPRVSSKAYVDDSELEEEDSQL